MDSEMTRAPRCLINYINTLGSSKSPVCTQDLQKRRKDKHERIKVYLSF